MEISRIYLYRITHIENVNHILRYGITRRQSDSHNNQFVSIGDSSLINFRESKQVEVKGEIIKLGDYIPFYFGVRMPMLYVIQHGYNNTKQTNPEDIIYIAVSLERIIANEDINYFFSNGHATDSVTTFFDKTDAKRLPDLIDWEAIKTRIWSGNNIDIDLKRRKQAEFLVGCDIPPEYIYGFVCYNEKAKQRLKDLGVEELKIKVFPKAYF